MEITEFKDIRGNEEVSITEVVSAHTARQAVAASATYLPEKIQNDARYAWARDLDELSKRAAQAEHGAKPVSGSELRIRYNPRFPQEMNAEIVEGFARTRAEQGGAVHLIQFKEPVPGEPPYNAVLIETTRQLTPEGFGEKIEAARENRGGEIWDDPAIDAHTELDNHEDTYLFSTYYSEHPEHFDDPDGHKKFDRWMVEKGYSSPPPSAEELRAREAARYADVRDWTPGNAADNNPTQEEFDKWYSSALSESAKARSEGQEPQWSVRDLLHGLHQQHRRVIGAAVREEFGDTLSDAEFEAQINERSMLTYVDASGKQIVPQPRFPELGPHRIPKDSMQLAGLHYLKRGSGLSAGAIADAHGNREGVVIRTVLLPEKLEEMKDDPRVARLHTPGQVLRMAEESEEEGGVVAREIRIQLNQKFPLHKNVNLVREFARERIHLNGSAAEIIVYDAPIDAKHPYQAVVLETDRKANLKGFGIKTHNAERGRQMYDPAHRVPLEYEWIQTGLNGVQQMALQDIHKREGGQWEDFHDWALKNYSHVSCFAPIVDQGRHTEPAELAKGRITGWKTNDEYEPPPPGAQESKAAASDNAHNGGVRRQPVSNPGPHRIPQDSLQLAGLHYLRRRDGIDAAEVSDNHASRQGIVERTVVLPWRLQKLQDNPRIARMREPAQLMRMAEEAIQKGDAEAARELRIQFNSHLSLKTNIEMVHRFVRGRVSRTDQAAEVIIYEKTVEAEHPYQAVVLETARTVNTRGLGVKVRNWERSKETCGPNHPLPVEYEWTKLTLNDVQSYTLESMYEDDPASLQMPFDEWARERYSHVPYAFPSRKAGRYTELPEFAKGRITGLGEGEKYPLSAAQPALRKSVAATVDQDYISQVRKNSVAIVRQTSANKSAGFAGTDAKAGGAEKNAASSKGKDSMDSAL